MGACWLVKQGYELPLGGQPWDHRGPCVQRSAVPGTRTLPWGREMRVFPVYQGERGGHREAAWGPVLLA